MGLFLDYYHEGETLDAMFSHPQFEPVMFRAIDKFPRSVKMLQTLLDAGFSFLPRPDDAAAGSRGRGRGGAGQSPCLGAQPQKRVSTPIIDLLIDCSKVNFETRLIADASHAGSSAPAPRSRQVADPGRGGSRCGGRHREHAHDDSHQDRGDIGTAMMKFIRPRTRPKMMVIPCITPPGTSIFRPCKCSSSTATMSTSPARSMAAAVLLGELCLHAAHAGPLTAVAQEKQMERPWPSSSANKQTLTIRADGKSVLLLALNPRLTPSPRPARPQGRALATRQPAAQPLHRRHLHLLLHAVHRAGPSFGAGGHPPAAPRAPQSQPRHRHLLRQRRSAKPLDATALLPELLRAERERRAQAERIAGHGRAQPRWHELQIAAINNQTFLARAEIEDSRARRRHEDDRIRGARAAGVGGVVVCGRAAAPARPRGEAALAHEQRLTEAGLTRARLVADAEMELEGGSSR